MNNLFFKAIKAGVIVGTLDILAAFIYYFIITGNKNLFNIFKYIASGLFGKEELSENMMILAGLILHYVIAFAFTIFFFSIFPKIKTFFTDRIVIGIIYGIFIWLTMNLVIVPLSNIPNQPFDTANAIINAIILITCIGIPLSYMANTFYKRRIAELGNS